MRIDLAKTLAKLTNYNPNSVLHGEERVPVGYIRFRVSAPNGILDKLHGTLRHALFFHDVENPEKDLVDKAMEENPDYLPHLRFPMLVAPVKWKDVMVGGNLTIHRGIGGESDMKFPIEKLDDIHLTPKPGGTVEITFRIMTKPSKEQGGELTTLHQREVEITVEGPKAAEEELALGTVADAPGAAT